MKKKILSVLLVLVMVCAIFPTSSMKVKADEKITRITCTEEDAYEKGMEYFYVWYMVNQGNAAGHLMWNSKNNLPGTSIIERYSSRIGLFNEITQWRLLKFDLQDVLDHGAVEEAYCEACLYDLVCGKETAWTDGVTINGDLETAVDNLCLGTWSKVAKEFAGEYNDEVEITKGTKASDLTPEQIEKLKEIIGTEMDYDKLSKSFKWGSNIGKAIEWSGNVGDLLDGFARIKLLLQNSSENSQILESLTSYTTNSAYQNALSNYSKYISGAITEDQANQIYAGTLTSQQLGWKIKDLLWDHVGSKIGVLMGVEIAETTAKTTATLANFITGNEDRYSAYEKMAVSHDMEQILYFYMDNLIDQVNTGDNEDAEKFLAAYDLLERMYEVCFDDTEEYYDAAYREGCLNKVFPDINQDTYDRMMLGLDCCRNGVSGMFEEDRYNAEEAYAKAKAKYDPEEETPKVTVSAPEDIEQKKEDYENHAEDFRLYTNSDRILTEDKEIFGNAYVDAADLDLNGHKLIVHGDLILKTSDNRNSNNDVTLNGNVEVYGSVYDIYNTSYCWLDVTGGSSLIIHEDMILSGTYVKVTSGKMKIGGDLTLSGGGLILESGAQIDISGNYTATNNAYLSGNDSSILNIGGSFSQEYQKINSNPVPSSMKINMTGDKDITIKNLRGGQLTIDNAGSRSITLSDVVAPSGFHNGTDNETIVADSDNLLLGGTLNTDLKVNGNVTFYTYGTGPDLNEHKLTITGDACHYKDSYSAGNNTQVLINKGTLEVEGNYAIAALENGEYVACDYTGLTMIYPEDHVIVDGNLIINLANTYNAFNTLTDGILEVKGNITQTGKSTGFNPGDNHTTYLNGSKLQKIKLEGYPDSCFNQLVLFQYEENYLFNPENCWNSITYYCEHTNTIVQNVKEVTCLEDGYSGDVVCADCGTVLEKGTAIEATGHQIEALPTIAATCQAPGQTGGRVCKICGKVTKAPTVLPQLDHQPQTVEAVKATCTEPGKTAGSVCDLCGTVLEGCEEIPAAGHKIVEDPAVKPTVRTTGKTAGSHCSVCGEIIVTQEEIAKLVSPVTSMKLSTTSYTYDGKVKSPTITVTTENGTVVDPSNYVVSYPSDRKSVGVHKVNITFQGDEYLGSLSASFTILTKTTSITKVSALSKGFKVIWKKQATQTTGYQIQYSTSSKFSSAKTVTITKNTTVSSSVKKLTSKKKYYVRIRTYKTVSSKKYYSSWSSAKYVTTK